MMTATERNAVISLLEEALDKLAMERYDSAETLINRALYWINGTDDDQFDLEDSWEELDFGREDR